MKCASAIARGLVLTGLALCTTGCGPVDSAATAPPRRPAERDARGSSAIAESLHRETPLTAQGPEAGETPDELIDLFRYLENQSRLARTADTGDVTSIHLHRINAANKLLNMELTGDQRFAAVTAKLDALLGLIAAGDAGAKQEFREFADPLANDPHQRIMEAASVAQLFADVNSQLGVKAPKWDSVIRATKALSLRFPESIDVAIELNSIAEKVLQAGHRDAWKQMLEAQAAVYSRSTHRRLAEMAQIQRTRLGLASMDFDGIVNRIADGESAAVAEFDELTRGVLAGPNPDTAAIPRLIAAIDWLESGRHFDRARKLNESLAASAARMSETAIRETIERNVAARTTRLALAGQTINSEMPLANGETLEFSSYTGRHLVVVFWSPAQPASVDLIREIAESRGAADTSRGETHTSRGETHKSAWELVAICLSKNANIPRTLFGGELPEWPIVISTGTDRDLGEEFGVVAAPHVMIINPSGIVEATLVPPAIVKAQIREWSDKPSKSDCP